MLLDLLMKRTSFLLVIGSLLLAPFAAAAAAEDTAQAAAGPGGGLEEIVVTAQRRVEDVQKAALAITVVDADALTRAGVSDAAQLSRVAPALQIGNVGGSTNAFYLRGVGSVTNSTLNDAAISFNVDGVPFVRSQGAQAVFYDLDRIEVLKGPQGTLYGRNSTGGAINVISTKPRIGELGYYANYEYGNHGTSKLTGALNLPLGNESAVRFSALVSDHDGYYSDGLGDDETRAARLQVASQMTERFKVTVGADYASQGGNGTGATLHGFDGSDRIGVLDGRADAVFASTYVFHAGNTLHPLPHDYYNDNSFWGAYAQGDIETPIGTVTFLPAYRNFDNKERNYSSAFAVSQQIKDEQTSLEVRLVSSDASRLSYILGAYYLKEDIDAHSSFAQQYVAGYVVGLSQTESYAGFGRLTYKLTDRLRLTGGIRYTTDDKSAHIDGYQSIVTCVPALLGVGSCPGTPALPDTIAPPAMLFAPNGALIPMQPYGPGGAALVTARLLNDPSERFSKTTYRVGVERDLGDSSLLFAAFETGFKSGGFFNSIDNPVYQPETLSAYSVGSKNRFFGNRVQLNAEVFWWDYKDQQVAHFRANSIGVAEFVTENVGKTRIKGVEIDARARVLVDTTLSATVQYLDARNEDFVYAAPATVGPPVTGCPVSGPTPAGVFVVDCSGRTPAHAPKWTVVAGIEHPIELGSAGKLTINVDGRYRSRSYTGFEQLPQQIQDGNFTADLQLRYSLPGGHITIAGFVDNLTDEAVVSFSAPHAQAPSLIVDRLQPPRTYGIRIGYRH